MKNAIRLYNVILMFYPHSYREFFGAQMMQTFMDNYKDVEESDGSVSIRFGISAITDEIQNILRQHATSLTEGNNFLKVTVSKLVVSAILLVPLYAVFCALLVKISLALPHPHVSGIGALIALTAILLLLPGLLGGMTSWVFASALVSVFPKRKVCNI